MTFIVGIKCKLSSGSIEPTFHHKAVAVFLEQIKEIMALLLLWNTLKPNSIMPYMLSRSL